MRRVLPLIHPLHTPHSWHVEELCLKLFQVVGIGDEDLDEAFEGAVAGVEADGAHVHVHRV